jgi:hypothetical protein
LLVVPKTFSHNCTNREKWVEILVDRTESKSSFITSQYN